MTWLIYTLSEDVVPHTITDLDRCRWLSSPEFLLYYSANVESKCRCITNTFYIFD